MWLVAPPLIGAMGPQPASFEEARVMALSPVVAAVHAFEMHHTEGLSQRPAAGRNEYQNALEQWETSRRHRDRWISFMLLAGVAFFGLLALNVMGETRLRRRVAGMLEGASQAPSSPSAPA
jgi:GT2 family glycosyltransferase